MDLNFTTPQSEFMQLDCKRPLFIGGYGTGKTFTAISNAWRDLSENPGATIAIYSCTNDLLELNLIPRTKQFLEDLLVRYDYNATLKVMTIPGAGTIVFRSMDKPDRIVSYESFRSHTDELDLLPKDKAEKAWNRIIARDRQKLGKPNKSSAYSTPEGFQFTYDRWSKNPGKGYRYVNASTESNLQNLPDDYVDDLSDTYTSEQLKAYSLGLWTNLASGTVYTQYDKNLNNTDVVEGNYETLHVGMDFNVMKGAAIIHVLRGGKPYAVGEIVDSYDTPAAVLAIKERYPNNPVIVYPDSTGKNRKSSDASESDFAVLKLAGFKIAQTHNPLIKDRVASMNAMFCNDKGERRYLVNQEKCPHYSLCLEQQVYDKNGVPDKSSDLDHAVDAGGYYIYKQFPIRKRLASSVSVGGF